MNREIVCRDNFKRNILKNTIIRLDFQTILQSEMNNILSILKPLMEDEFFNRYNKTIAIQKDMNDLDCEAEVHIFTSESRGLTLELSQSFIAFTIQTQSYVPFEEYSKIFIEVSQIYKKNVHFFVAERFGFRKVNFCFLKDFLIINKYFVKDYYSCNKSFFDYDMKKSEKCDIFSNGKQNINIKYSVDKGEIENEIVYRILLDSDIYSINKEDIKDIDHMDSYMKDMNNILFKIYVSVLTEYFINLLTEVDDLPDEILGVCDNE